MTALTSTIIDPNFTPLVDLIARLHQGATIEQAASELGGLTARLESEAPPGATRGLTPVVRSYEDVVVGDVRLTLFVLFAAVGLVLLIASANVGNLLLMRGEGRRAEMAIRSTLGASRSRLARQMLAESLVLALASGAAGLAVTWWSLSALIALVPDGLPRVDSIRLDAGVLGFAMAIAFITSALAGMAPALSASRIDLVSQSRRGGGMRGSGTRHGRRTLVVVQVALAITVVAAAGLLTRSVLQLEAADMGLTAEELVLVQLALPQAKYVERDRRLQFLDDVVKELEATPGIAGATPVNTPPFAGTGGWDAATFTVEGQSADRAAANSSLNLESIHPNYFATVGVSLIRGRGFGPADREGAPNVVIVSEDVAARTWPGEEPIGKRLKLGGATSEEPWRTVVGVARMTRYRELREPRATVYLPAAQFMFAADAIVLRTASPARVVAGAARDRIRAVDPAVQVMRVTPFADLLDRPTGSTALRRIRARCVWHRGADIGGDRTVCGDGGLRAPAQHRDRHSRRARRDRVGCAPSGRGRRTVARRTRCCHRTRRRRGDNPAVARSAVRRASPGCGVDARGGAAGRRRVGAGIVSTRVARRACQSPHPAQSRLNNGGGTCLRRFDLLFVLQVPGDAAGVVPG